MHFPIPTASLQSRGYILGVVTGTVKPRALHSSGQYCEVFAFSAGPWHGGAGAARARPGRGAAALRALFRPQARTVSGRARAQGGFEDVFSLEVLGPVLPHALHALTLVLGPAQRGAFRALLSPHEPSAAFNARPAPAQVRTHPRDLPFAPGFPGSPLALLLPQQWVTGAPQRELQALPAETLTRCVPSAGGCAAGPACLRAASQDFGSAAAVSDSGKILHPLAGDEGLHLHLEGLGMLLVHGAGHSQGCRC